MTDHPFIAAVQAALDTHGLPDGVTMLHIGLSKYNLTGVYCVIDLGDGNTSRTQPSLTLAMIAATEARARREAEIAERQAKIAERQAARAALVAAGHDPALIAA